MVPSPLAVVLAVLMWLLLMIVALVSERHSLVESVSAMVLIVSSFVGIVALLAWWGV